MTEEEYAASLFDLLDKLEPRFSIESYWDGVKMTKMTWLSTWEATFHRLNKTTERNQLLENVMLLCAEALSDLYGLDDFLRTRPTIYPWWELIGV